jgi:beta-glucosidase
MAGNRNYPCRTLRKRKSEIAKTISMAEKSDVIVAVMGESEREVGESRSRSSLNLPGKQTYFLQQLYKTGKPVVLVLVNGRPLTINWENKYLPAILETWFLGPQSGKDCCRNAVWGS